MILVNTNTDPYLHIISIGGIRFGDRHTYNPIAYLRTCGMCYTIPSPDLCLPDYSPILTNCIGGAMPTGANIPVPYHSGLLLIAIIRSHSEFYAKIRKVIYGRVNAHHYCPLIGASFELLGGDL